MVEKEPFQALRFTLKTERYDDNPDEEALIVIVFRFNEKYPDGAPDWEIEETENINDEENINKFLRQQVKICALIHVDFYRI